MKNLFNIAWRGLLRDKRFTLLNLLGISTGLTCTLLIYFWVLDEKSIDSFHEKDSRLYQVMKINPNGDGSFDTRETVSALLAPSLAEDLPEVEYTVPIVRRDKGIVAVGDKQVKSKGRFVGKDYFNVFSNRLLSGNKSNVLKDKYGVIISDKLALKLFNTTRNLIGRTVEWDHGNELKGAYTVSGVFEAPPENASDQFDILFSYSLYYDSFREKYNLMRWNNNPMLTYLTLKEGTDVNQFNRKIKDYLKTKHRALHGNQGLEWQGTIFLQHYSDRYLYNKFENGIQVGGRIGYVKMFSLIAVFILLIACINFMNLSTAKASGRMKEAGIRKVIGARRRTLILQYISESMLLVFIALLLALVFVWMLLPAFENLTGKIFHLSFDKDLILSILGIAITTGLISGSYPALYLSAFKPVMALKGKLTTSSGETWLRKGLVVFQFCVSVIMIIAMLVAYRQLNFIQTKNLGYNKDNVIMFGTEGKLKENQFSFFQEIKKIPGVLNASGMGGDLIGNHGGGSGVEWEGKTSEVEFSRVYAGYDLIETLDIKMADGRSFSRQFGSDSSKVIFNETAIAAMGLKNPVGKMVKLWGKEKQIIGVAKDFHFESLHEKLKPFFFEYIPNNTSMIIKIKAGTERKTLADIEKVYKSYNTGLPFEYQFMDAGYQSLYTSENRVATLSKYFTGLAIVISCLGLFGLATFTAHKRQKEIGIRKVIGASVINLAFLLTKDFLKLILTAVLIAFPVSWWMMNRWLLDFEYRITISADVFLFAAGSIILLTLVTICSQSLKTALMNPIKSLR